MTDTTRGRKLRATSALAVALLGATTLATTTGLAWAANETALQHEVVLDNLEMPWDMAFLGDGTMFFTEKCRGLSVRMPSGEVNLLLGMDATSGFPATADDLF